MTEENVKCKIRSFQSLNIFSPAIVDFEYGSHGRRENSNLKCDLYVSPENHLQRALVVKKDGQQFLGELPSDVPLCHTLVLVRNKRTNKARVLMAQSCTLINSAREEESIKRKIAEKSEVKEKSDWQKQSHTLRQSFGSKKSKRASNVAAKLNLDMSMKQDEIKDMIADVEVNLSDMNTSNQGEEEILKLLPPCDRNASSREGVYSMDAVITEDERDSLKASAEYLIQNGLSETDQKTNYFLYSQYSHLGSNPDITNVILIIYGNSLVRFFNMSAGEMRAMDATKKICPYSRTVGLKILKEFSVMTNSVRTRPNLYKDKIICYLMVTMLLACNFRLDIEALSACLKGFGQKKLIQLGRVVGITSEKGKTKEYSLKIPLPPLPKVRQPRKK